MKTLRSIFAGTSDINFAPIWMRSLPAAAGLAVASLLLLLVAGLDLSIDFEGGGIFEVPVADDTTVEEARAAVSDATARIQKVSDPDRGAFIRVQTGSDALGSSSTVVAELAELGGVSLDAVSINEVGPTWGDQITDKAVRALVLFFVAVALYLAWSLEWRMAIGALAAVVHDLLITAGIYSLFRF